MRLPAACTLVLALVPPPGAGAQVPGEPAYRLGPRDQLRVRVFEEPSLSGEVRIDDGGDIEFFPVGKIDAQGKTPQELAQELQRRLEGRYLQRATVSVEILELRSRPISVIGAVRQPGPLDVSGNLSLIEAITAAGGLTENHGKSIYILRKAPNGLSDQVEINIHDLLVAADRRVNLPIFANDLINVPPQQEVVVYCLGEVAQPGALRFSSNERLTVLAAVARAGGLTERASRQILIKRTRRDGREEEIQTDYKRIVAGKDPDVELAAGDVLVIKESFF